MVRGPRRLRTPTLWLRSTARGPGIGPRRPGITSRSGTPWADDGVEDRGAATVEDLAEADATWTAEAAARVPGTNEWGLVLGDDDGAGHWKLEAVEAGARFAFQGRVFETADADGNGLIEVRPTGDVLGWVVNTFVRIALEVVHADIDYADGTRSRAPRTTRSGCPVLATTCRWARWRSGRSCMCRGAGDPRQQDVATGRLRDLRLRSRGAAQLLRAGLGSDAAGVLVHNSKATSSVGARSLGEAVASEMGENAGKFGKCVERADAAQKNSSDAG